MARWYITDHAVDQFRARVDPSGGWQASLIALENGVHQSARLKGKTYGGESRYLLQTPKCIAIVKHDAGTQVVVTILSVTGDQGRKWIATSEPSAVVPDWKPLHHPDWADLRAETKDALAMMLLRAATKADVRAPIAAWMRMQ